MSLIFVARGGKTSGGGGVDATCGTRQGNRKDRNKAERNTEIRRKKRGKEEQELHFLLCVPSTCSTCKGTLANNCTPGTGLSASFEHFAHVGVYNHCVFVLGVGRNESHTVALALKHSPTSKNTIGVNSYFALGGIVVCRGMSICPGCI